MSQVIENAAVKVGDVFVSSWGYDQTNVDFYQVVGVTASSARVRRIGKTVVSGRGEPNEHVMPVPNNFIGDVMTKRIRSSDRPGFRVASYAWASKWNGKPESQTGWAYGR